MPKESLIESYCHEYFLKASNSRHDFHLDHAHHISNLSSIELLPPNVRQEFLPSSPLPNTAPDQHGLLWSNVPGGCYFTTRPERNFGFCDDLYLERNPGPCCRLALHPGPGISAISAINTLID